MRRLRRPQSQGFRNLCPRHVRTTSSEQQAGLDLIKFRPGGGEQPQAGKHSGRIRGIGIASGPCREPDEIGIRDRLAGVLPRAAGEAVGAGLGQCGTGAIQVGSITVIIGRHTP